MIKVVNPGLLTTIQDHGRWGYQAYGMPVAGAMDQDAYRIANILAGNADNAAALEMTLAGGSFLFEQDCLVALCGADMQGRLNGQPVANWSAFAAEAGSELTFGFAQTGCRTYLAVRGGIDVPLVLGSRSTYTRGGIGGLEGRALRAGDTLRTGTEAVRPARPRVLPPDYIPDYASPVAVRVLLGPQDDLFTAAGLSTLGKDLYIITDEADRMGYRLEGSKIEHMGKADIISDALCLGAIQVPGHGMPIVMMADRQTTGGYAKIGAVIGPDLSRLAQAKPGDSVRFIPCSDEEAVTAVEAQAERYRRIAALLVEKSRGRRFQVTVNGQTYFVEVEEEG